MGACSHRDDPSGRVLARTSVQARFALTTFAAAAAGVSPAAMRAAVRAASSSPSISRATPNEPSSASSSSSSFASTGAGGGSTGVEALGISSAATVLVGSSLFAEGGLGVGGLGEGTTGDATTMPAGDAGTRIGAAGGGMAGSMRFASHESNNCLDL